MKVIKSALLGSKSIIDSNQEAILFQLREIIREHRERIIIRLISDLPTYIDYKFQVKASQRMLDQVKEKLIQLKSSGVDLTIYNSVVQQVLVKANTHLTNEPFYIEIDQYLEPYCRERELGFSKKETVA